MHLSTYGYKIQDQGDKAKGTSGWMASTAYNFTRLDAHNHDGVNSPLLSQQARALQVFNVKDFGAAGDGSTDDTAAIQAALDAAMDINVTIGGVYFPPVRDQYIISTTLDVDGATAITIFGAGPQESQIKFVGGNAVPMFRLSGVMTSGIEMHNLALENAGSATVGIQVNCTKVYLHNLYSVSPQKFSRAIISDFQASTYNYYSVIRDCYFSASDIGKETPTAIELCEGHTKLVDSVMLTGFPVGIKLHQGGYGGHLLGASITNCHIEAFDGAAAGYPGSADAYGIYADKVMGLNITGCNFQMNGTGTVLGGAQRDIYLNDVTGGVISGNLFFRQGEANSAAITIATANISQVVIKGNTFYDCITGIEVLNRNAIYEIGMNNGLSTTTLVNDTATPSFTSLTVVVGGGSVAYSGRYSWSGNRVFFTFQITPTGGATTASTANTTKFNWPGMPTPLRLDTCFVTTDSTENFGTGLVYTDGHVYTPTWSASTSKIIISGSYLAA